MELKLSRTVHYTLIYFIILSTHDFEEDFTLFFRGIKKHLKLLIKKEIAKPQR